MTLVNHAPTGTSNTVTTLENTAYAFATSDFGFSDPNDNPPNNFLAVKITTLPTAGAISDNSVAVTAGQFVAVSDITAGLFKFTPAANASGSPYTSLTFQVEDDGGTANGGMNLDPSPKTMTINVTWVNQAPTGTSNTITTPENTAYTFATSDFGFSDPYDNPPNNFLAVKITTLPAAGRSVTTVWRWRPVSSSPSAISRPGYSSSPRQPMPAARRMRALLSRSRTMAAPPTEA